MGPWLPAWLPKRKGGPLPGGQRACELGALGGTRTPNLLIRRSGHIVQDRPLRSLRWADIPLMSAWDAPCPAAWQQCWLQSRRPGADPRPSAFQAGHIPSWRGSCERYPLSPVAAGSRWLLLLLSAAVRGNDNARRPGPGRHHQLCVGVPPVPCSNPSPNPAAAVEHSLLALTVSFPRRA